MNEGNQRKPLFESQLSGGVHSPESFGFDVDNNPSDAQAWEEITGETPIISLTTPIVEPPMGDHNGMDNELEYWESQGF